MSFDTEFAQGLILLVILLNGLAVGLLLAGKAWFRAHYRRRARCREALNTAVLQGDLSGIGHGNWSMILFEYSRLRDEIHIPPLLEKALAEDPRTKKTGQKWRWRLCHGGKSARIGGAHGLSLFSDAISGELLSRRIQVEKSWIVRLHIAQALVRLGATEAIPAIAATLRTGKDWYRYRLTEILLGFGQDLLPYVCAVLDIGEEATIPLALAYGRRFINARIQSRIEELAAGNRTCSLEAAKVLADSYPGQLDDPRFLWHENREIRQLAWRSLAWKPDLGTLKRLVQVAGNSSLADSAGSAIREIVDRNPEYLSHLLSAFEGEHDALAEEARGEVSLESYTERVFRCDTIAKVLASRLDYFFYGKINSERLISWLIQRHKVAALASFLQGNRNSEIEDAILAILADILKKNPGYKRAVARELGPREREKLGIAPIEVEKRRSALEIGIGAKAFLVSLVIILIAAPPLLLAILKPVQGEGIAAFVLRFCNQYNSFFAWYALALQGMYILLLVSSFLNVVAQLRKWQEARTSFLLTNRMLPPVSIIVPAYREENSIVDSVHALLALNYPQYEIIVVCDGSPDHTLERITEALKMERGDYEAYSRLPSARVRGVYRSDRYPYVTVIDKVNGGKADALNAGINFARHDYLCCVDADSLLEGEALLKMMYQVISTEKELVAAAGNILPVNGCAVKMGAIERYAPPRAALARFQMVEYLRSFLAGRLGWSFMNSLLIISGAFGVFRRQRVLEVGGYLTGEGAGRFDTVGEDMELVVRLARYMREHKLRYTISYAFNANCWTEVPEDLASLRRQRDRWHRGLIEILLYHRACILNPRYGRMGLVGIPYFWLFELIGPFLEAGGLLSLCLTAILASVDPGVLGLLFIATVLLGTAVSTLSLAISEFGVMYFATGETLKLLAFSILENFGFRQLMSLSRVGAFASAIRGVSSWGTMVRKGFTKAA